MKRLTLAASLLGLALAACGGDDADDAASGGKGGTFEGTVAGQSLDVKEVLFAYVAQENTAVLAVVLADQTGLCAKMQASKSPPNLTTFVVGVFNTVASGTASVTPGTYTNFQIGAGKFAIGAFDKEDAQCISTVEADTGSVVSGSVKLDSFEAKAGGIARGSFDVKVGEQNDAVKGTFNATFCDLPFALTDTSDTLCE